MIFENTCTGQHTESNENKVLKQSKCLTWATLSLPNEDLPTDRPTDLPMSTVPRIHTI